MDINNILGKIEDYKKQTAEKAEQERVAAEHHRQRLLDQIRVMKPDIDNLIKVAKAAQEAGIPLKANYMIDKTYDNGDFFTDAMTHKVGFVQTSITNQAIIGVGFEGGGCCGQYDFFTNGSVIYDKNRDNGHDREASTEHLEKFIERFPEFERAFCDYIEKVTDCELKQSPKEKFFVELVNNESKNYKVQSTLFSTAEEAERWFNSTIDYVDYTEMSAYLMKTVGDEDNYDVFQVRKL